MFHCEWKDNAAVGTMLRGGFLLLDDQTYVGVLDYYLQGAQVPPWKQVRHHLDHDWHCHYFQCCLESHVGHDTQARGAKGSQGKLSQHIHIVYLPVFGTNI